MPSIAIGWGLRMTGPLTLLGLLTLAASLEAQENQVAFAAPTTPPVLTTPEQPTELVAPPLPEVEAARQAEAEETARRWRFFNAIADNDKKTFVELLNGGIDPNAELPFPVPPEFKKRFSADERLSYYISSERGFTGLMMATSLGNLPFVKFLLAAGANPLSMTKRHRTYALWLAGKYGHVEIMRCLMGIDEEHESRAYRITVDLATQHVTLWHKNQIEVYDRISSGRESHPTPTGTYLVTDKYRMWNSTLYHAKMPFFMRLSCSDFGLHVGVLPGYPASHGCIRLPEEAAKKMFSTVPIGTLVEIR